MIGPERGVNITSQALFEVTGLDCGVSSDVGLIWLIAHLDTGAEASVWALSIST